MRLIPNSQVLGARVENFDLSQPIGSQESEQIIEWLGEYGAFYTASKSPCEMGNPWAILSFVICTLPLRLYPKILPKN